MSSWSTDSDGDSEMVFAAHPATGKSSWADEVDAQDAYGRHVCVASSSL